MKKKLTFILLPILSLGFNPYIYANDYQPNPMQPANSSSADDLTNIARYLKNLGANLGYQLEDDSVKPVEGLINTTYSIASAGKPILNLLFGSIPVNAFNTALQAFTKDNYGELNALANATFVKSSYNKPSDTKVSVTENFDQKEWQNDPVSQSILNIVGTPDYSVCDPNSKTPCISSYITMEKVLLDIISNEDKLPGETVYYTYENNKKFINQLNSNTLIAPLLYSEEESIEGNKGLTAKSQAATAEEFIRYATAAVLPAPSISQKDYSNLLTVANAELKSPNDANYNTEPTNDQIIGARKALASYLLSVRVYAAQSSVAISNLYAILAKRMPQEIKVSDSENTSTSQALTEFQMATWRLHNPNQPDQKDQWVNQINTASPARVQKEIAILLSEINYQLYLSRQQDERMLLTNSLQLLQNLSQHQPNTTPIEQSNESAGQ